MNKLKVLELFGGIAAFSKALERNGIPYEIVDYVDWDKYATKAFNAIHETNYEPQDISEWDKEIEVDLLCHGSPCQSFSVAGKGAGGDKGSGTQSSLMWETVRIIEKLKPKYVIWENVKNLLSKKHRHNFDAYLEILDKFGYNSYYKVLNAKDFGVPQNRERVFTLSIRKDIDDGSFVFPEPMPLKRKLKDILEDEVDKSFYLSDKRLENIYAWEERQRENGRGFRFETKDGDAIGRAVTTSGDRPASTNYVIEPHYTEKSLKCIKNNIVKGNVVNTITANAMQSSTHNNCALIKTTNKQGYDLAKEGDSVDLACPNSDTRRGRVRKLTPKECWRLMGRDDWEFEKAREAGISNTQLYKIAGNSIVVSCPTAIFSQLFSFKKWNSLCLEDKEKLLDLVKQCNDPDTFSSFHTAKSNDSSITSTPPKL